MINFKLENKMYDLFIDNNVLTTQELLKIGFTNKDLTRLVETGKIHRVKRGFYDLENAQGLFYYVKLLLSKKRGSLDKAVKGLYRCAELEPNNGAIHTRVFLNSLFNEDFDQALKSFAVMEQNDSESYKRDQNMWLFLLNYVVDLPEEYKTRVKNMQLSDMLTLVDDDRYCDRLLQNKIRNAIYQRNFKDAQILNNSSEPYKEKKIYAVITENLLRLARWANIREHNKLYDLIGKGDYELAEQQLIAMKESHGITFIDEYFLIVLRDLISIMKDKKIPVADSSIEIKCFNDALIAHDYKTLLKKYRVSIGMKTSISSKYMGILLERIDSEISRIEILNNIEKEKAAAEGELAKVSNDVLLASIVTNLVRRNVDGALELLDKYLVSIGKSNCRGYVADLIKLSVIRKDPSFSEPILLLSELSSDEFDGDVSIYMMDFYFSMKNKKFKEAAIFLDILSMSEALGGVAFPTYDLKESLLREAAKAGITEEELGITENNIESVSDDVDKDAVVGITEEILETTEKPEVGVSESASDDASVETIDSLIDATYSLADLFDNILDGTNMLMLEPMSDEEIAKVIAAAVRVPRIQATTIEDETGARRVVLRYYDKFGCYIDIGETLKAANQKYKNWEYDEAINLYQSVMPKLEQPKSFIFERLARCYERTTYDGDYSIAIDYYTMAMAQSRNEERQLDYTATISRLKEKSKYNGVKVEMGNGPIQYVKKYDQ